MDTEAVSPPKDFLAELMRGAHPVHQRKGNGTTIVLDNTARFDKVLQSSYPQQPREWFEKDGTAHPLGRTYVKGQQRWMNMPQPARVREALGRLNVLAFFPTFSSDPASHQKLEAGKAWERGYNVFVIWPYTEYPRSQAFPASSSDHCKRSRTGGGEGLGRRLTLNMSADFL